MGNSVARLERRIRKLEVDSRKRSYSPQLAYSSIDDGFLEVTADAATTMVVGLQADGTHAPLVVAGPTPPTPTGVDAVGAIGGITAYWDGTFVDGQVSPLDFARVEIHASQDGPDFVADIVGDGSTTMRATISSPRGERVMISGLTDGQWYFRFVTRTLAGKWSTPSDPVGPVFVERVSASDLEPGTIESGFTLADDGVVTIGQATLSPTSGLVIPHPSGTTRVPLDGSGGASYVADDVTTDNLRVKGTALISGSAQVQGEATLADGIQAPTAAPTISQEWPFVLSDTLGDGATDRSSVWGGMDERIGRSDQWVVGGAYLGNAIIRVVGKSAGGWGGDITDGQAWTGGFTPTGGIASDGVSYYLLGRDSSRNSAWYLYKVSATGAKQAELKIGSDSTFPRTPRIVFDSSKVGIAWIDASNALSLQWYTPSPLAKTGSKIILVSDTGSPYNIGDVFYGDNGSGATRLTVAYQGSGGFKVFNPSSAYARVTGEEWDRPSGSAKITGLAYDSASGRMVQMDSVGRLWTFSKILTDTSIQAVYTFYDGDNSVYPAGTWGDSRDGTASGTHETLPSPVATATVAARAWPVFETPPAPDEGVTDAYLVDKANRIGLYFGTSSLHRYGFLSVGQRSLSGVDTWPSSGTPPISDGFSSASASPGSIHSAAARADGKPKTEILGSGAARMDGLVGPGDIIMSARPTAALGYLLCDGSDVSRTTYPDLFAAIGTTYGAGDGSTTFTLPSISGSSAIGVSAIKFFIRV